MPAQLKPVSAGRSAFRRLTFTEAVMIIVGGNVARLYCRCRAARASDTSAVLICLVTTTFSVVSHLYIVEIMLHGAAQAAGS